MEAPVVKRESEGESFPEGSWSAVFRNPLLWVSSLGYFVDLFDLVLFGVYRVQSLRALGLTEEQVFSQGAWLHNVQMAGMLTGGFLWGILGDRLGRVKVLFASIACYSLANLGNAFIETVPQYGVARFFSGLGLAGEFGVAVTLVSEVLPRRIRGLGSTLIAAVGFLGAMSAAGLSHLIPWRQGYLLGGGLGLLLLLARFRVRDSVVFLQSRDRTSDFGQVQWLLKDAPLFKRYVLCLLVGVPIWFVAGILMSFAPEIGRDLGIQGEILAGTTILLGYAGSTIGDVLAGAISQLMMSRRRAIALFLSLDLGLILVLYFLMAGVGAREFYLFSFFLGIANGYWALFAVVASEQFGTNLRSTVTTSLTNLVRGASVPMIFAFTAMKPAFGAQTAATLVGATVMVLAFFALSRLRETFDADLDYLEKAPEGRSRAR